MTSGIYFCDSKGKLLLSRRYKDDIPANAIEQFPHLLIEKEQESSVLPPCFSFNGVQYLFIQHNDLYVLTLTKSMSINVAQVFSYLHKLIEVLEEYMKVVEEESIKDNFVIIYELLDEMMDHGIPQITDTKMLRQYITQKSFKLIRSAKKKKNVVRPPATLTNSVSWRPEGIVYKKNEAFLDVVESINMLLTQQGQVLRSEILGKVKVKSRLSGMPDLKLGLNDKGIFAQGDDDDDEEGASGGTKKKSNIELEDLKFHQCVRLTKFENEKIITFIPPDGDFELMSYRLSTPIKPLIWCDVKLQVHSRSRIEIHCRAKAQIKKKSTANNVEILIPVPEDADSPKFRYSHGTIKWVPSQNAILWKIKSFPGGKDYSMAAEMGLPSVSDNSDHKLKRPVQIKFQIPYFTTSGIQVRYLKINEPKMQYNSYPWVRYITQSGDDYTIRM
ncbi:ADL017Cp [Eremothecium gossypii ATCC 10895]|uniref:ADL017Cp n=1 Tax=Eremothecium gossypii (strain ATCC 10895 / CBS 109.51 / FGSC 9923 / NRRL Y-1056) TaxID=284811 RepID=Q75AD4_EREGS|nr:ADL017Cp [Eremothecium gossypii ATCC 10895]AAS51904.1 ADL017Cp [Eremothecium gossypii ATCC 10895]AEY96203.1 FADL017Cp [Eremothecium gossypii FDAG1]